MIADLHSKLTGIRAVAIDLDGTMVDTAADFHVAINRMRAEFGMTPVSIETVIRFVGKGMEHLVRSILAEDVAADELDTLFPRAFASYDRHYRNINGDHSRLYPDVLGGLEAMQAQGLRLACVTNKPIAFARQLLQKTGLLSYFEVIYGGDSLPRKKPDPCAMLQVCRDFDLQPIQLLAIGDSINDALSARAAGCSVLAVPYGYNEGQSVHTLDVDAIVDSIDAAALWVAAR